MKDKTSEKDIRESELSEESQVDLDELFDGLGALEE